VADASQGRGQAVNVGHFGLAAAVKSHERETPLWALMLASQWLDVIFVPLVLSRVESFHWADPARPGYGGLIIFADYTHSLIGMAVLSALLGGIAAWRWGRRSGLVIGLVSASHWLLDLIVHRGDMPILPGNLGGLPRLGFGLWRVPWASATVEAALLVLGAWLYWRAAQQVSRAAGTGMRAAVLTSSLIVLSGGLTLWLDLSTA
jgi:hypothetical protein